jgi:putative DNA primase/helicase
MRKEGIPDVVQADILSGDVPDTHLAWAETMMEAGYRQRIMYVPHAGWHVWSGKIWENDAEGKITYGIVHQFAKMYREAPYAVKDADKQAKLVGMVRRAETDAHVKAVMNMLSSLVLTGIGELNPDAWLLNTPAGILDLRTRDLFLHDPARRMTMITRGNWDPDIFLESRFREVVEQIVPNKARREYLQEMCGVALVGEVVEQIALVWHGPTAGNGKSTLGEALQWAAGDYAITGDPEILTAVDRHPENIAVLHGKRLVMFSELPEKKELAATGFKRLTGDDTVSARFLYKERFEFRPRFMMMMRANDLPYIPGDDEGTWRRLKVVLFEVVFRGAADDRGLRRVLNSRAEATAALTWMLEGLARYLDRGRYLEPECVRADTEEQRESTDQVGQFWRECVLVPGTAEERAAAFVSYHDIWLAYGLWWTEQSGKGGMSQVALTKKLRKRPGLDHYKNREGVRGIRGVALARNVKIPRSSRA